MRTSVIEWGAATLTLPGQTECGDRHVIVQLPDGVLVGVVDGLGHGREAAEAAECVVSTINKHVNHHTALVDLLERCHENLQGMRGAAMSLVMFDQSRTLTWLGVGDVEGRLLRRNDVGDRQQKSLLLRPGVVGEHLPPLYPAKLDLARHDMVILATDGVDRDFTEGIEFNNEPQQIADDIITRHSKRTDDALVLVARYGA